MGWDGMGWDGIIGGRRKLVVRWGRCLRCSCIGCRCAVDVL